VLQPQVGPGCRPGTAAHAADALQAIVREDPAAAPPDPSGGHAATTTATVHRIRLDGPFRLPLLAFGALRRNSWVRLDQDRLTARFGFFSLAFALAKIQHVERQGPWRWWMSVGVRGTLGRPEITFGGSAHGGVALTLSRPIPRWWWIRNLREVYFTLEDPGGFIDELARRGLIDG
jgi:hypothetical protein